MKIAYMPHKTYPEWHKEIRWGGDFFLENVQKYAPKKWIIEPIYKLDNLNDAPNFDLIWIHNIATSCYQKILFYNTWPIIKILKQKNRPIIIGGVRGDPGYNRTSHILHHFDAIHCSNDKLTNIIKLKHNKNSYTLSPGVNCNLFLPDKSKIEYTIGWAGDSEKPMKNYKIITKLGYNYIIANKQNYIPHREMPKFYNRIKIYTHFSSNEGFNRTVLEAAACGLPVVCTDVGGANKLIDESYRIQYKNNEEYLINEFKNRIDYLLSNPGEIQKQSNMNLKKAQNFDWKCVVERWKEICEQVRNK